MESSKLVLVQTFLLEILEHIAIPSYLTTSQIYRLGHCFEERSVVEISRRNIESIPKCGHIFAVLHVECEVAVFPVHLADQRLQSDIRLLPREESHEVGEGAEANPVVALIEEGAVPLQQSPGGGQRSVLDIKLFM